MARPKTYDNENATLSSIETKVANSIYRAKRSREPKKTAEELRAFIFGTPEVKSV